MENSVSVSFGLRTAYIMEEMVLKFQICSFHISVILLPLCPASLTHKKCQRCKIICGMHPVGCQAQSIDLKMFLWNILLV